MNSLEYEVDSMGGLMPQILALTAPPGARDNNRQPFQQQPPVSTSASSSQLATNGNGAGKVPDSGLAAHPYFRRPGRGHNHDCCDACSEGGDLICCDLCPASFHLTCHDPPLEEEEIPTGEWACHQCRMEKNEEEKTTTTVAKTSKVSKPSKKKEKEEKPCEKKVFAGGREIEISDTPLTTLIKAAAVINPTQFTLPYELTLPANFPGEPKETLIKKNGSRRGLPKKKPYELDNGIVPLPAKLCFQCNKSCRIGPLIPCDFCPLFYHLDCLDPPLATPPMGRWMCPNHPEHHMDTSLLMSHSLTERVKLWDKFSVPVDQDAVKLNFLQRCHRLNPPFRYKLKKVLRSRLRVPGSIKSHYKDPPDLLPHLSPSHYIPFPPPYDPYPVTSPTNSNLITKNTSLPTTTSHCQSGRVEQPSALTDTSEDQKMEIEKRVEELKEKEDTTEEPAREDGSECSSLKPTQEEMDQWLASLLLLQSSTLRHLAKKDPLSLKSPLGSGTPKEPCNGMAQSPSPTPLETKPNFLNGDLVSHDSKAHRIGLDGMSNHINSRPLAFSYPQTSLFFSGNKKTHRPQKVKTSCSKSSKQRKNTQTEILSDTLSNLEMILREKVEENSAEVSVTSLEQSVIEVLAYQRLKQIMEPSKPKVEFSCPPLSARALLCPLVPDIRLKDYAPQKKYSKDPVPMTYRILNIGKGSQNHVNLELYGHCNYISHHHACILFDETTGHYELLNYSEFSTKVDGVTYHCDFTDKTVSQAVPPPFLQQVKAIIAKRRGVQSLRVASPPPAMTSRPGENFIRCECKRKEENGCSSKQSEESGWEGTAVLHHGSYIRFGCLKFVFSVVEEASKGDWSQDTLLTYEKFLKEADNDREELKDKDKKLKKEEKTCVKS